MLELFSVGNKINEITPPKVIPIVWKNMIYINPLAI